MRESDIEQLMATLKRAGAALREAGIPYMLGGSLAGWARGGPAATKDLDLMVRPEDADAALRTLAEAGLRTERPPEEWLFKAWDGDVLVDLIFRPSGLEVEDGLARAERMPVQAMEVPVMRLEDMLVTQLLSFDEHHLDYPKLLAIVRALREQVDFGEVRQRTADSPFARAFFVLAEGLGIVGAPSDAPAGVDA